MILEKSKNLNFYKHYKKFNLLSLILIVFSISTLIFSGLNLGVDFKGGTLIEIRTQDNNVNISQIRNSFLNMDLGDVSVKKFGNKNDFLIKIEMVDSDNNSFISSIREKLSLDLNSDVNFRRVEKVGPKVSNELLKDGLLAITLSLAAMLFYIWIRFDGI